MVELNDRAWDVFLMLLSVACGKAADIIWERLKEKAPRAHGKHFPRS